MTTSAAGGSDDSMGRWGRDARLAAEADLVVASHGDSATVRALCTVPASPPGWYDNQVVACSRHLELHRFGCRHTRWRSWPDVKSMDDVVSEGWKLCPACTPSLFHAELVEVAAFDRAARPLRQAAIATFVDLEAGVAANPDNLAALACAWVHASDVATAVTTDGPADAWQVLLGALPDVFTQVRQAAQPDVVEVLSGEAARVVTLADRDSLAGWDRRSSRHMHILRAQAWEALAAGALPSECLETLPARSRGRRRALHMVSLTLDAAGRGGQVGGPARRFVLAAADTLHPLRPHPYALAAATVFGDPVLTGRYLSGRWTHSLHFHGTAPGAVADALDLLH